VQDKNGLDGQNNPNPQSLFGAHMVVLEHQVTKKLYDPSYGNVYGDLVALEIAAIYGYSAFDVNNKTNMPIRKMDPKNPGLQFTPDNVLPP
jgi:hypothetical protein